MLTIATIGTLVALLRYDGAPAEPGLMWAGHQVSYGSREIPFRGEVTTRMDTLVLARVAFAGTSVVIDQIACAVRFDDVGGVRVSMDASGLPRSRLSFAMSPGGDGFVAKSVVAWGDEDVDHDGNPGITVGVQAPVCSGELYVSNRSRTSAQGRFDGEVFRGRAKVRVDQRVLGTRGRCLAMVAEDTEELVSGPFAYTHVASDATCASLISSGWPIDAES